MGLTSSRWLWVSTPSAMTLSPRTWARFVTAATMATPVGCVADVGDEALVDLDDVDGQPAQVAQ